MIFADKLIQLRKKSGWSQEELAEQMDVTRQSVSKWEGAQSIPDLDKMIRLSELFGVSTDYLLKDSMGEPEHLSQNEGISEYRRVSMEEANAFISAKLKTAKPIAYGIFLCILSPICFFILGALSEIPKYGLSENTAVGVGMIVMFVLAAAAVVIFLLCGSKTSKYEYLEKEAFETEYGVTGMVNARKEQYRESYTRNNIIGVCFCVASLIPIFLGLILDGDNDLLMMGMLCALFVMAGIGVTFLVSGGIVWASYEKLLQEGDYSREKKANDSAFSHISLAYWMIATAVYLGYSLITGSWKTTWIVWPIAGVLYPAVSAIFNAVRARKRGG